jgi:hypothetical protein
MSSEVKTETAQSCRKGNVSMFKQKTQKIIIPPHRNTHNSLKIGITFIESYTVICDKTKQQIPE